MELFGKQKEESKVSRPIFYPKDASMEHLLPLEASLKNIKLAKETEYTPDPPVIAMVEKGLRDLHSFLTRFNDERRMNKKLAALDTPETLTVIRKIDPEKLVENFKVKNE